MVKTMKIKELAVSNPKEVEVEIEIADLIKIWIVGLIVVSCLKIKISKGMEVMEVQIMLIKNLKNILSWKKEVQGVLVWLKELKRSV